MKKIAYSLFGIISLLVLLNVIFLYVERQRFLSANKPLWSSNVSLTEDIRIEVSKREGYLLVLDNNSLLLVRSNQSDIKPLIINVSSSVKSLKVFYKDLERDGNKEIVLVVNNTDMYVFYSLHSPKVGRYKVSGFKRGTNKLFFDENDTLYIQYCGSQYCNDTFYSWTGQSLTKAHEESFESL